MAITPALISKNVTTAGTRVEITSDTNLKPVSIYIEAKAANTGYIYVGLVTVSSTVYFTKLAAGSGISFESPDPDGPIAAVGLQLSNFYIDSSVNGEGVQVTYLERNG